MRRLASPAFHDDDGRPDPVLTGALQRHAIRRDSGAVVHALCTARLLVPVVAGMQGPEQPTEMSAVSLRGRDGRTALLAFSSVTTLTTWEAAARPVPVTAADAARSARAEGAAALLLDVAGPVPFAVLSPDLDGLAAGHLLMPARGGYAWVPAAPGVVS